MGRERRPDRRRLGCCGSAAGAAAARRSPVISHAARPATARRTAVNAPDERRVLLEGFRDYLALEGGSSREHDRKLPAGPRAIRRVRRDAKRVDGTRRRHPTAAPRLRLPAQGLGLAPATIRRQVSALRTYFRFLIGEGTAPRRSERSSRDAAKRRAGCHRCSRSPEVEAILAAPQSDDAAGVAGPGPPRARLRRGPSGLRALRARAHDLLRSEGLVRVFGKGDKERLVPIGRKIIGAVAVYLNTIRPTLDRGKTRAAAAERPGRPLTPGGRLGNREAARPSGAGIEKRVTPHTLRHSLRDPPPRGRRRPARGAGDARPRRPLDDPDLHPRGPGVLAVGPPAISSAWVTGLL